MHTISVILGGLILLAVFVVLAHVTGRAFTPLARWYLGLWFACAGVNMLVGVSHAGYSVLEELPVFFLVFAVPATIALVLARTLR